MDISHKGLRRIVLREGLELEAYQDSAGVWTIGVGHTRTAKPGMKITEHQAHVLFVEDIRESVSDVNRYVSVPLKQNQFDALVSFVFNVGGTAFRASTLRKRLNEGEYDLAAAEFPRWNKVTVDDVKRVEDGLVYRRAAELAEWYEDRIQKEFDLPNTTII